MVTPAAPTTPPGPAPPGPAPPARAPGRTTRRTVLIIVGVALVVCCGLATGGWLLVRNITQAAGPARTAADGFLADLEAANYSGAYERLCDRTRDQFTRDAFESGVRAQPKLRSHRILTTSVTTINGRASGFVSAELTYDNGFVDRHSIPLAKDGDDWRVCGQPY